jgi:subtilase family serine protease
MIYNTKSSNGTYGSIVLSGNGVITLTAPTSGTYAGILIFQDRANSKALTFSGGAMRGTAGTIYAPAAQLAESGGAQIGTASNPVSIVVDTLSVIGSGVANAVTLSAPSGTAAYTPAQIRAAYGVNALNGMNSVLPLDGTGQTIAIVDAYDDPSIFQSIDAFDIQFGLTSSGPTLYDQYGPASSFLTVLNQSGQATSLPGSDPSGAGVANWELEEALDVEWIHAMSWSRPTASRSPT